MDDISREKTEIAAAEYLLERLLKIKEKALLRKEKKEKKYRQRVLDLEEFSSYEEAHEMWGYGYIDDEDLEIVKKRFEGIEEKCMEEDRDSYIINWIDIFCIDLQGQINASRYELMSPEERENLLKENDEMEKRLSGRRRKR